MQKQKKKEQSRTEFLMKFLKDYGFFLKSDSIYEGLFGIYDKGPAAVKLQKAIKDRWWNFFVNKKENIYPYESSILTSSQTLSASGHIKKFIDEVFLCKKCHKKIKQNLVNEEEKEKEIFCENCKNLNEWDKVNYDLLFETWQGSEKSKKQKIYLRPETAQGIFTNFKKIKNIWKLNLPFGLAQIGKVFRNEVTTKYTNFKSCEFQLMEIEFFFGEKEKSKNWFNYWEKEIWTFLLDILRINQKNLRVKKINKKELAHYSEQTLDFEYFFPFGWQEIWGLSMRSNFDLKTHQEKSGDNLQVSYQNKQILPYVIEPSVGLERLMLMVINEKLQYENEKITLQIPFDFCYYQIAVLPLTEKITPLAKEIQKQLDKNYSTKLDSKKSIGKRYVFHDAIGTYFCITVDFQSPKDRKVTLRFRDTKKQFRIEIKNLNKYIQNESTK